MNEHIEHVYNLWQKGNKHPNVWAKDMAISEMADYIVNHRSEFDTRNLSKSDSHVLDQLGELMTSDINLIRDRMKWN